MTSNHPDPIDSLNQKFLTQAKELRKQELELLDALIIFHQNTLYMLEKVSKKITVMGALNLSEYDLLKTLAHGLIYYSIKHGMRYRKMSDLCPSLQERYRNEHTKIYWDWDIETLMENASQIFLEELHGIAQTLRQQKFNGEWPPKLVILVSGPASPRFGHPAMQYFARLTNSPLEMRYKCPRDAHDSPVDNSHINEAVSYQPQDPTKYTGRRLYYVENATSVDEVIRLGGSLYVEDTIYATYKDMSTDILSEDVQKYLQRSCIYATSKDMHILSDVEKYLQERFTK